MKEEREDIEFIKQYGVEFTYRGSSTDWLPQKTRSIFDTEEKLARFLVKNTDKSQYEIDCVKIVYWGVLPEEDVNKIVNNYKSNEEEKERVRQEKIDRLKQQLLDEFTNEELEFIKNEKII